MPQRETLRVEGYRDLLRALATADKETRRSVRAMLRETAEAVKTDATRDLLRDNPKSAKSAAGYRIYVRQRGVAVEQSLRKTTGLHPEWGKYQMKHAFLPALAENAGETERRMEAALDQIAEKFNNGPAMRHD